MNHIIINESCFNMRREARHALNGNWKPAIVTTILLLAATIIPSAIAETIFGGNLGRLMSNIYLLVVSGPFYLGYTYFMVKLYRRKQIGPSDAFYGFEHFAKSAFLYIVMGFFILLWTLLFIIPGIVASYRYRLAYFVLMDNPDIGILDALNESKRLMKGNKGKLFFLDISFIGWFLLSMITVGLGLIALIPYASAASVVFYELANGNIEPKAIDISFGNQQNDNADSINVIEPITPKAD
jgi:uncharacterized membrane protein